MKVVPIKSYKNPGYPDKRMVLDNPDILKMTPGRWKFKICARAVISTLIMASLTACREDFDDRATYGCMSVAPPSYMSEEEAFKIIQEEAKKYGIAFEKREIQIRDVDIPETKYYLGAGQGIDTVSKGDLLLDGYDEEKKVAFEFISQKDYDSWHKIELNSTGEAQYDFITVSNMLRDELNKKEKELKIGVFSDTRKQYPAEQQEVLREQVKTFMEWLKGQGII